MGGTNRNVGQVDRTKWSKGHNDSVWVQAAFEGLGADDIAPGVFAYPPVWAACDPGMTLEAHEHEIVELYVFIGGTGRMRLGDEWFDVRDGITVHIPSNVTHQVECPASAPGPVMWLSIGLR